MGLPIADETGYAGDVLRDHRHRRSPCSSSGSVFTGVAAFRFLGGRMADREIVAAHALFWYVLAAVFSAVWLIVYVTQVMLPTGSKLLIGGAVLATVAAIVYGLTQEGSLGTVGLIFAAAALAFLAGVVIVHPRGRRLGDGPGGDSPSRLPPPAPPGDSIWPVVSGRRRRARRRRPRHVPADLHLRHHRPARRRRRLDGAGLQRAGVGRRRRSTPPSAGASPTRWSSRSSPPSAWRSSSTRSAGSCCSCPRRADRRCSPSSPRSCWPSASSSPSCRRSSPALIAVVAVIAGARADRRRRRRRPRRRARACTPTRRRRQLAAEGKCDTPEETEADEHASQNVAAKANIDGRGHAARGRHARRSTTSA